jgi:hypothetical protein
MPEALALAAGQHHTTPSEWVPQTLLRGLEADGICIQEGKAAVSDRRYVQGGSLGDPRSN